MRQEPAALTLFTSTFAVIFLAELPDKTALATLALASRVRPSAVFAGAAAAFLFQTMVAVGFGHALAHLPARWVRLATGALFLAFAVVALRQVEENEGEARIGARGFWRAALAAFGVIFLAEWGDLTQLATVALVARSRRPAVIFAASICALWSVSALAVFFGHRAGRRIRPRLLQRLAACAFAAVGLYLLLA